MTITFELNERFRQQTWTATLYDAETNASDGEWFSAGGFDIWTIDISGINGETLEICGSNAAVRPDDTTHGRLLGSAVIADGIYASVVPLLWVKLRISIAGAGSVTARFLGITRED